MEFTYRSGPGDKSQGLSTSYYLEEKLIWSGDKYIYTWLYRTSVFQGVHLDTHPKITRLPLSPPADVSTPTQSNCWLYLLQAQSTPNYTRIYSFDTLLSTREFNILLHSGSSYTYSPSTTLKFMSKTEQFTLVDINLLCGVWNWIWKHWRT